MAPTVALIVTAALTGKTLHTRSSSETDKMTSGVMKNAIRSVSFSGDEKPRATSSHSQI
jgi:hypothetical protein